MTLKVPEANTATFRKVMEALGGEDYSYYSFDVKNIQDAESRKKVQILLKVYVPQAERNRATERITKALMDDGVDVLTGDNQIDAFIPNSDGKKVIRLKLNHLLVVLVLVQMSRRLLSLLSASMLPCSMSVEIWILSQRKPRPGEQSSVILLE